MKKSLYIAAALMSVVGCSKSELAPETAGTHDINVSVAVSTGDDTRAVFDGDSHIKFEKGDYFYAAVAKKETPTKGVKVAKAKELPPECITLYSKSRISRPQLLSSMASFGA